MAALPCLGSGPTDPGEGVATNSGTARPADAQLGLVLDATVGAIPAGSDHFRQFPGSDSPVGPGEDRAADKEHEQGAGQQVFHVGENSRADVI